jgi:ADP-heptose:LPS heptosyltransferase
VDFLSFINQKKKFKFLIIRDGLLGDITFITPIINRLRNKFPDSTIDVVVSSNSVDVLKNYPGVRRVIPLKSKSSLFYHIKFFIGLRKEKYDVCLVQEVNSHYTLMSLLVGAKYRIGFINKADRFLNLKFQRKGHTVLAELGTVKTWTEEVNEDRPTLFINESENSDALSTLKKLGIEKDDIIICLQVGSSTDNSPKQWVDKYFAELADRLLKNKNAKIVFIGSSREVEHIREIQNMMKQTSIEYAEGVSIRELIAFIKQVHLVIGPDTGPLHFADSLNIPAIILFGYMDPADTGVFIPGEFARNISVKLDCVPCNPKNPKPAQWEICKNIRPTLCMEKLSVDKVEEVVLDILNKKYNISVADK